jgi:hypothetical protein
MKKIAGFLVLGMVCCLDVSLASAQAWVRGEPFGERWQVGIAGSAVNPDYSNSIIGGGMIYGSYNASRYLGVEARTHYAYKSNGEREFSIGGGYRFMLPVGRFEPFAGGLIGYGNFGDGNPIVKVTQTNSFTISYLAGVDLHASRHFNVRLFEVESQVWANFQPNGLNPVAYSAGVAWHP